MLWLDSLIEMQVLETDNQYDRIAENYFGLAHIAEFLY